MTEPTAAHINPKRLDCAKLDLSRLRFVFICCARNPGNIAAVLEGACSQKHRLA